MRPATSCHARLWTAVAAALVGTATSAVPAPDDRDARFEIRVLSNRPDLISGGDALVDVELPRTASVSNVRLDLDGRDVTGAFALRPNGRFQGLLTGLAVGANVLTARLPNQRGERITITNHPNGGPVFSGPQIQPWICNAGAVDAQCNRPAAYEFRYRSTDPAKTGFLAYDPASPPSDVARTTTDQGRSVPFVVRIETGYQDRDQYRIAVLFDPARPWAPWAPQEGWNGKLFLTHGAGCGTGYTPAAAPDVLDANALSRGFAVMSTALDNTGHNCNMVVQAESLMMAKEHLIETYGPVRYTMGFGGSGGALVQHWVANAYPGIYDGLVVVASYPDAWSTMLEIEDCSLLRRYFSDQSRWAPGVTWTAEQQAAASGHASNATCAAWVGPAGETGFAYLFNPSVPGGLSCVGVPPEQVYHPQTNPGGVRCTLQDYTVSVVGRRRDGFANRALDNVGVEYGRKALLSGQISAAQYADLNAKIGSHDIDYNWQSTRFTADQAALRTIYRSGLSNQANQLDQVAIIDIRGPEPAGIHHEYRSWAMRARLDRANGHHDNQAIWFGPLPLLGDPAFLQQYFDTMDRWLAAVEADKSGRPLEQKIVGNRPHEARDRCTNGQGVDVACTATTDASPRIVAGQPITDDVDKCRLKPLSADAYGTAAFTAEQWQELQATFRRGVCDYGQPGVGQQPTVPWLTYEGGPHGRPLPRAPESQPVGGIVRP